MALRWHGFAVPKRGNSAAEYEDAFAGNPRVGRFALADGASESSFASLWAKLLVDGFTHPPPELTSGEDWLGSLRQRWSAEVETLELPWYAEAKRGLGAAATFLGLIVKRAAKTGGGPWLASAVGDCCLFQLHQERVVKAFPVTRSEDFGNQPKLLISKPGRQRSLRKYQQQDRGTWEAGDRMLLMTDALAQWFLSRHEQEGKPWQAIARVLSHARPDQAFESWIDKLRDRSGLRNDDVTLVVIAL
jgi:hypothetical protein